MKHIWSFGLLFICLASCKPKPEEYYVKRIKIGPRTINTTKVIIDKSVQANKTRLTYKTAFDTVSYIIDNQNKKKSQLLPPTYGAESFHLVEDYSVKVANKEYRIFHFSTFDGTMDGGSEHYWNEDLGVFFTRGRSWPNYFVLESTDEKKNKIIWNLVKEVYPAIKDRLEDIDWLEKEGLTAKGEKAATNNM